MGRARESRRRDAHGSSRDAFVAATGRLLRQQGYAATGLNEIVAESGAPKGSLYFHFPGGKEELAVAAMEREGARLGAAIASILSSEEDLSRALARLLDTLAAGLERSDYRDGCPIATVALEAAADSDAIQTGAAAAFASWQRVLERRLIAAGLTPQRAARRAVLVLAAFEGALVLARAQRDLGPIEAVREELIELSL